MAIGFKYTPYQLEKDVKKKSTKKSTSTMPTLEEANKALGITNGITSKPAALSGSEKLEKLKKETGITTNVKSNTTNTSSTPTNTIQNYVASMPQVNQGGSGASALAQVTAPVYNVPAPNEADFKIDLTSMLAAFNQAAQTSKDMANTTYNTTRGDLLKSIERFRDQHAKQVETQKRAYLSNQASLQDARAEINRMNRINAASRGLAGSGLQQLSQLQNLMAQGQDISDLALANQDTMENLRTILANAEEDSATDLANAVTARDNAIKSIESTLGTNKANLEYNAAQTAKSQYLNALEAWNNRQFQASENAKSRALTQAQMERDAADKRYAAETAYNNTLATLNSSLKKLKDTSNSRTLSAYATEAGLTYTPETIDDMTKAQKADLKHLIAENYAMGADTVLTDLDRDYYLPLENSNKNKKTVNEILASYGYSNYY